jgi:hypothetical protein
MLSPQSSQGKFNPAAKQNMLVSFRGIFLCYEGETGFVREEPKFIRLRLWGNGLEAYPTNAFQGEQHRTMLRPMMTPSIQDNHVTRGPYVCALPHNKLLFRRTRLWEIDS